MKERLLKLFDKHMRMWRMSENFRSRLHHAYMADRVANIVFGRYAIALDGPRV